MEENKELLELLQKIEKANRQQVKLTRVVCIFALVAALCCICTVGLVYNVLPQINTIISQMQIVLGNLETATAQLSVVDFSGMIADVEALVTTAQQSLDQTMNKLNTIDFQTLNKAIDDLAKVVEPMSKLMNVFK
ncbi:MAG: hypothetical protein IIX49_00160 [Oscillospiraceae bacterium]|nr:hypothetical protein [Oscillospiraceae bacterium]